MKKLFAVIKKEYKVIVKKKSFIVMTVLTPVLMAGMMFVPVLLMRVGRTDKTIAVADYAGGYIQALNAKPAEKKERKKSGVDLDTIDQQKALRESGGRITFQAVDLAGRDAAALVKETLPAEEIMRTMFAQAEELLNKAGSWVS